MIGFSWLVDLLVDRREGGHSAFPFFDRRGLVWVRRRGKAVYIRGLGKGSFWRCGGKGESIVGCDDFLWLTCRLCDKTGDGMDAKGGGWRLLSPLADHHEFLQ